MKEKLQMNETERVLILKLVFQITIIMIAVTSIFKLAGFEIFDPEKSYNMLSFISNVIDNLYLRNIIDYILLFIQNYIFFRLVCRNKNTKTYFTFAIIASSLAFLSQFLLWSINKTLLIDLLYLLSTLFIAILIPVFIDIKIKYVDKNKPERMITNQLLIKVLNIKIIQWLINIYKKINGNIKRINKKLKKIFIIRIVIGIWKRIKKPIAYSLILIIYQIIAMWLRDITLVQTYESIYNFLLNIDYMILLLITYYLFLKNKTPKKYRSEIDFSFIKILSKRPSSKEVKMTLAEFRQKFKESNKTDKLIVIFCIIFQLIYEFFNLAMIIFLARWIGVVNECIFILTAFWFSRKHFGSFHFESALKCFVVSNITFFILSNLSINIWLSYPIPLALGVVLAWLTSKFIKTQKIKEVVYKGMSEKELIEIVKNKNLEKIELEILKNFYCEGRSIDNLTFKYHYSRRQLYRYKKMAENKLTAF